MTQIDPAMTSRTRHDSVATAANADQQLTNLLPRYSEHDVAAMLGVSVRTVRSWRTDQRRGGPDYLKIGMNVRYSAQAIVEYLHRQTRTAE